MKSDYDEIIRNAFSEKIEAPKEYQQKIKETLKQAGTAQPPKKQRLSLAVGICACLGLIIVLSVFLKADQSGKYFNNPNKQYALASTTPVATKHTVTTDDSPRTETPADTELPRKTKLPLDTIKPTLTAAGTHIPENSGIPKKGQKNNTKVAQTKNSPRPGNSTTANHEPDTTNTPSRNKATRSPELAQVETSYTPESIETPRETTAPSSMDIPEKTKAPENNPSSPTNEPTAPMPPDSGTTFPTGAEAPAKTPVQTSMMPTST